MARYIIDNRPEPINFEIGDSPIARTLQNAKNLLLTQMGEVPYDRYRGFDPALYHLPLEEMRRVLLPELDRLMGYEPDAQVVEATPELNEDGEVIITVTLEITIGE